MLDPGRDAPGRDGVANEAKSQIEAGGTLKHENNWGLRKLAYEIAQRNEADYRWFRFEAPTELLEQLDHNLKIADGVAFEKLNLLRTMSLGVLAVVVLWC